ncbi:DNA-binding MarR family transcriptional regulator [Labrenzia sp. EL_142]|nr:DNA-binding MarR family transcriptional regulator [Labrenzia sp. EL_142]MBG6211192.1 DNA-binding MarR family transcriptional regulator [Labrenzia sp. EL_126]
MTFSRETSPGYLVNHLARLFANALQEKIKPLGLSTGVFPIMIHLWENDGLTQKELVERVGIEQATMANTLARMERDGLVYRQQDPKDRRIRHTWLTENGRALQNPTLTIAMEQNRSALAGLSKTEQQQIIALISKAIRAFETDGSQ